MARRTNKDKGKESLELLGIKIEPALKKAIEAEGNALGIPMSTYARQLLITGWQLRHEAPVSKNPREAILLDWFNDLPIREQENILAMVKALHKKHVSAYSISETPQPADPIPITPSKSLPAGRITASIYDRSSKKGGRK